MGTPPREWLRGLAALTLAAALAAPALGSNYPEYANASLQNELAKMRIQRNLYRFITGDYLGPTSYWWAEVQTNRTMTENWSTRIYNTILEAIATNATAQANLNLGFLALGQNASQLNCGNASGGNCQTLAGQQGASRVAKEKIALAKGGDPNCACVMGRLRAEMFKYWASWYVHTQRGIVAILNTFSQ